jgi:hypothetical protein
MSVTHHRQNPLECNYPVHSYSVEDYLNRRKPSSGMLRRVAVVRADVPEGCIASIISVTRICHLGTMLAIRSSETLVLTTATWRHIQ